MKGPADKMMAELGEDVSNTGVARRYAGICDTLVIDVSDAHEAASVEQAGMSVHVAPTVMTSDAEKVALAEEALALVRRHPRVRAAGKPG